MNLRLGLILIAYCMVSFIRESLSLLWCDLSQFVFKLCSSSEQTGKSIINPSKVDMNFSFENVFDVDAKNQFRPESAMHPVPHVLARATITRRSTSRYCRPRAMSLENPKLLEALTMYERLKRCQECDQDPNEDTRDIRQPSDTYQTSMSQDSVNGSQSFYPGSHSMKPGCSLNHLTCDSIPINPFSPDFGDQNQDNSSPSFKFADINLQDGNYLYFSPDTGILQSKSLKDLFEDESDMDYSQLLLAKQYWLDIVSPTKDDLQLLRSSFQINDSTIKDIMNGSVEEKVEMYGHYTYICLNIMPEEDSYLTSNQETKRNKGKSHNTSKAVPKGKSYFSMRPTDLNQKEMSEELQHLYIDVDLRNDSLKKPFAQKINYALSSNDKTKESPYQLHLLLFSSFVITVHQKQWSGVKDVLNFLSIMIDFGGQSPPLPEWILFSVFVEFSQTAKKKIRILTPKVLRIRGDLVNAKEAREMDLQKLSVVLKNNVQQEFELQSVSRFIKPKLQILRTIQLTGRSRLPNFPGIIRFLINTAGILDELLDEVENLTLILERSQDTFLALAGVQQSVEANEMGYVMKRISEIAMIFLPIQAVAGFLGMNVQVPYQADESTNPFWLVVLTSVMVALSIFAMKSLFLTGRKTKIEKVYAKCSGAKSETDDDNLEEIVKER